MANDFAFEMAASAVRFGAGVTRFETVTGTAGGFIFSAVPNGVYTVTPINCGRQITPASQRITVNANFRVPNFSVARIPLAASICGRVIDIDRNVRVIVS